MCGQSHAPVFSQDKRPRLVCFRRSEYFCHGPGSCWPVRRGRMDKDGTGLPGSLSGHGCGSPSGALGGIGRISGGLRGLFTCQLLTWMLVWVMLLASY
ncbi:hypothetical protein J3F84DRAFT_390002 [Trichoderma pleuroticola]